MSLIRQDSQSLTFNAAGDPVTLQYDTQGAAYCALVIGWERANGHTDQQAAPTVDGAGMSSLGAVIAHATVTINARGYELHNPTEGAAVNVVINPVAGVGNGQAIATLYCYDEAPAVTPSDGYVTATGTASPATLSVTSEVGDTGLFWAFTKTAFAPTGYTPTNYTEGEADHVVGVYIGGGGSFAGAASVSPSAAIVAGAVNGWIAIGLNINADAGGGAASAAITGTAGDGATEAELAVGDQTTIATLTDDTWVASGATFDAQRQAILDGHAATGDAADVSAWEAYLATVPVTAVARTSDTVVTITWPTGLSIGGTTTIEQTVPAAALTGAAPIVATPTFAITNSPTHTSTTWEHGEFGPADTTYVLTFNDVDFSGVEEYSGRDFRSDLLTRLGSRART